MNTTAPYFSLQLPAMLHALKHHLTERWWGDTAFPELSEYADQTATTDAQCVVNLYRVIMNRHQIGAPLKITGTQFAEVSALLLGVHDGRDWWLTCELFHPVHPLTLEEMTARPLRPASRPYYLNTRGELMPL